MFRLVRLIVLVCVAFVIGVFYERAKMGERCDAQGGTPRGGVCVEINQ